MKITDINVSIGGRDAYGNLVTKEALLEMMDDFHIDHAVAYHQHALLDPKDGNEKMAEIAASSNGRLGICAVLDPVLGKENLPGEGNMTERLQALGANCVRIFPEHLKMGFLPFYWREILEAADELSLPLIIDEDYTTEFFERLPEVTQAYPNIKFILIRCGIWKSRYIFPLLATCENVYFTAEHMLDHMQIEEICEKGGASHLLFGSGYPGLPLSGVLGLLMYADITNEEREKILYQNWERIKL